MPEYRIAKEKSLDEVTEITKRSGMVFYGAITPWWTCERSDLYDTPSSDADLRLPCDPRGGVLFETNRPEDFMKAAVSNPAHYGKHKLRTFLLAYHGCVLVNTIDRGWRPTCLNTWKDYDELIDQLGDPAKRRAG